MTTLVTADRQRHVHVYTHTQIYMHAWHAVSDGNFKRCGIRSVPSFCESHCTHRTEQLLLDCCRSGFGTDDVEALAQKVLVPFLHARHCTYTTMHHTTQGTCIVTAAHTPQYTTPHRARLSLLQTQGSASLLQTRRAAMCKDWVIFKQAFAIGEERTPLLTFFPRWLSQCCLQDDQQPVRQHGIQRVATVTRVCDTRITGACVTRCLAVTAACPYRVRAWGQESRHLGTCAS